MDQSSASDIENFKKINFLITEKVDAMELKMQQLTLLNKQLTEENDVLKFNNRRLKAKLDALAVPTNNYTQKAQNILSFFSNGNNELDKVKNDLQIYEQQLNSLSFQNGHLNRNIERTNR